MISFIVIGRNEGWKLQKCFESISDTIERNRALDSELIYVDSDSSDNSIELSEHCGIEKKRILRINENYNAAVARNLGAKFARGNILFFIDGDMEINPCFLSEVMKSSSELENDYLSGQLIQNYLDSSDAIVKQEKIFKTLTRDRFEKATGGVFLVERKHWEAVNGMNPIFETQEDLDFGFRLAHFRKLYLLRKKEVIAFHNTLSSFRKKTLKDKFKDFRKMLYKGVLLRNNLFNRHIYNRMMRMDFTFIILIVSLILSIFQFWFLCLYPGVILVRLVFNILTKKSEILGRILNYLLRDLATLIGLLFYYPATPVPEYEIIL